MCAACSYQRPDWCFVCCSTYMGPGRPRLPSPLSPLGSGADGCCFCDDESACEKCGLRGRRVGERALMGRTLGPRARTFGVALWSDGDSRDADLDPIDEACCRLHDAKIAADDPHLYGILAAAAATRKSMW